MAHFLKYEKWNTIDFNRKIVVNLWFSHLYVFPIKKKVDQTLYGESETKVNCCFCKKERSLVHVMWFTHLMWKMWLFILLHGHSYGFQADSDASSVWAIQPDCICVQCLHLTNEWKLFREENVWKKKLFYSAIQK